MTEDSGVFDLRERLELAERERDIAREGLRVAVEMGDALRADVERLTTERDARPVISREDAAAWSVPLHLRRGPDSESATKGAAGRRIRSALRTHGEGLDRG